MKTLVDNIVQIVGMPQWSWVPLLLLMVKVFMESIICVEKLAT